MTSALIEAEELLERLSDPSVVILHATVVLPEPSEDSGRGARSGLELFDAGHIPGARHADLVDTLSRDDRPFRFAHPTAVDLASRLTDLGISGRREVVIYDDDRMFWSARLWWMMRALGLPNVRVLNGGLDAWRRVGGRIVTGSDVGSIQPMDPPEPLSPSEAYEAAFVDRDFVEKVVAGLQPGQIICALGQDVFSGRSAGRYSRSGHIRGAVNVPATDLVVDGHLAPQSQLTERFQQNLANPSPIVIYCGGGISACLDALALHEIGRNDVAVYDGSLEEWSADPSLELVVEL